VAIRIVVAEDEAIIRLDLRETLEEEGYEVVADCGRGDEAVQLVTQHKPDVAILDIKMPVMSGLEAANLISQAKICPVVMLTAFSQRDLVDRARQAGAMAYVVKPFSKADLVPAIEIARARFAEIQAVEAEVSDLRVLRPLDTPTLLASIARTHRAVIVDEGWKTGSLAGEIAAILGERAFWDLDAPIERVCTAEVPIPYARHLELAALPKVEDVVAAVHRVCHG
jgi:AmiR/NasT family two-component response regulator